MRQPTRTTPPCPTPIERGIAALRHACLPALLCMSPPGLAADPMRICLNWAPGADHAALYHARSQGWFAAADLAVELRPGGGSADALAKLGAGECEAAIADLGAVIAARRNGDPPVAVFAVFADSPLAFYAVAPTPLQGLADVAGKRVAADPKEAARRLWPTLAAQNGLDPSGPAWIDTPNNAKLQALKNGDADIVTNTFYHHHAEFTAAFGERLRVLWWRDFGVNPVGNVIAVRTSMARAAPQRVEKFVHVVQQAHGACVRDSGPCLDALTAANPHLDRDAEAAKWQAAAPLIAPKRRSGQPIGGFGDVPPPMREAVSERFLSPAHAIP